MSKLILIRHGQSIWNLQNRFAGWVDISLSEKGLKEAKRAAIKLKNMKFDVAYTSNLIRAQETLFEILNRNNFCNRYIRIHENENNWYSHFKHTKEDEAMLKVFETEKLNERYYGDLQGLNKEETKKKYGESLLQKWRRSFNINPPGGNALSITYDRVIPYFKSHIEKDLKREKIVIVAAHGNSLRAIIKYIEKVSDEDISKIELETGKPTLYEFDSKMKIKSKKFI